MTEYDLLLQIQFLDDGRNALAALASHLALAPLFDVPSHSGETTWQGTTPDAFNETLTMQCDALRSIADQVNEYASYIPGRLADLRWQLRELRDAQQAALAAASAE